MWRVHNDTLILIIIYSAPEVNVLRIHLVLFIMIGDVFHNFGMKSLPIVLLIKKESASNKVLGVENVYSRWCRCIIGSNVTTLPMVICGTRLSLGCGIFLPMVWMEKKCRVSLAQ